MNTMKSMKKVLLIIAGTVSLILGVLGTVIPVLPTTPFLLLSSFCYLRSSKTLYNWLVNHKLLGPYIYNYMTYRAIPRKAKITSIILLWLSLSVSFYLIESIIVNICIFVVGIGVCVYLVRLKTLEEDRDVS